MKKIWDKIFRKIKTNKRMMVFLFTLLFMAILFGSFYAIQLNEADLNEVKTSLDTFFQTVKEGKLESIPAFFQSFLANFFFVIVLFLLGISVIGIPFMLILFFMKAFTLGFTITVMMKLYKGKGILYSIAYIFPHQICNILIFTFFMMFALSLSAMLVLALFKKKTVDFSKIMKRYLLMFGTSLLLLVGTSLLETFLMPNIFRYLLSSL